MQHIAFDHHSELLQPIQMHETLWKHVFAMLQSQSLPMMFFHLAQHFFEGLSQLNGSFISSYALVEVQFLKSPMQV